VPHPVHPGRQEQARQPEHEHLGPQPHPGSPGAPGLLPAACRRRGGTPAGLVRATTSAAVPGSPRPCGVRLPRTAPAGSFRISEVNMAPAGLRCRTRAATHDAAHAVVGSALGMKFDCIYIFPHYGLWGGGVFWPESWKVEPTDDEEQDWLPCGANAPASPRAAVQFALATAAGPIAHALRWPDEAWSGAVQRGNGADMATVGCIGNRLAGEALGWFVQGFAPGVRQAPCR
ncbi:MAG: hypothetical protein ACI8PZ_006150, partial [Myxococcota bacterium]